jgi:hypothetical protein
MVVSRCEEGKPWRTESHERIGSGRRLNPVDGSTDFQDELKPLTARLEPAASLHETKRTPPCERSRRHVVARKRTRLGRPPRVTVDNKAQRGKECREMLRRLEGKPSEGGTPRASSV